MGDVQSDNWEWRNPQYPAPLSSAEERLVIRHRKYRRGCLKRIEPHFESRWKWMVDNGDGCVWQGMTPREAWEAFRRWYPSKPEYRGPDSTVNTDLNPASPTTP